MAIGDQIPDDTGGPPAPPPNSGGGGGAFDPDLATRTRQIIGLYQQYLKRVPGKSEIDAWLAANLPVQDIETRIKGSDEYKQKQGGAGNGAMPTWEGRSSDPDKIRSWLQWLATQPNTDPILKSPGGIDYYLQRITEKGGLGADNFGWWQNKGTMYSAGGGVGAPGEGGGSGQAMSIDPSYLKPFTGSFADAWGDLYGGSFDPGATPGDFQAPDPNTINQDQGYQFRKNQAIGGLQNSAAARGLLNSGGTLSDIMGLGDQMASQEYQNVWGRNFAQWNQNWSNYGNKFDRAWRQFVENKDTFYRNEDEPWSKLYQAASLGYNAAGA